MLCAFKTHTFYIYKLTSITSPFIDTINTQENMMINMILKQAFTHLTAKKPIKFLHISISIDITLNAHYKHKWFTTP